MIGDEEVRAVSDSEDAHDAELPPYHIASVGRALTLLSAFVSHPQLTISDAADLLDVAPSTAHRLMQMLVLHGFVEQGERRVYVRGPAIESLTRSVEPSSTLPSVVLPHLRRLRDEFQATAHLLALEGTSARFVIGLEWVEENRIASSRVGWLLPAHTLASGKAMLARLTTQQLDAMYPDGPPITRYGRITSMSQLHASLREVRARGYAQSGEAHEDVAGLGVALPPIGDQLMAISIAWPRERFPSRDVARIGSVLMSEVAEIAAELASIPAIPQKSPAAAHNASTAADASSGK